MQRVVQAPTITPPNEALTCEGCYYIKNDDYSPCAWCIRSKENEDYYRCPPEGEVGMVKYIGNGGDQNGATDI